MLILHNNFQMEKNKHTYIFNSGLPLLQQLVNNNNNN